MGDRVIDCETGSPPCPDFIAVIGGGRWARVLAEALCGIVPSSCAISVHSRHSAESMSAWASERGYEKRVLVSSDWPQALSGKSGAVIVANAARDHEKAIEWAISADYPVLVEKPITLNAAVSQRLADLARERGVCLAAAHVFLFARYLEKFSRMVANAGGARSVCVRWTDPRHERRYGEKKRFDPGLPVFADCLPHVLSVAGVVAPDRPQRCESVTFLKGGARLELELMLGAVRCCVFLERNGELRERIIEVTTERDTLQLDFSSEPGYIILGSTKIDADPDWALKRRPVARMLAAFLQWAAGGEYDRRFNVEIGLQANRVIDQVSGMYRAALIPWLTAKLAAPTGQNDDDLLYALSEILQYQGPLPESAIEQKVERVRQLFGSTSGAPWIRLLAETKDLSTIARAAAA